MDLTESQTSADWRGFADWIVVSGALQASEHKPRYHFGDHNIDETYSGTLWRADILALHNAAVASQGAFETECAARMGSWWTDLCSAADAAGITGANHPKVCARMHYRGPVTLT